MKVLILYRQRGESTRRVEEFVHDFKQAHPEARLEVQDIDSREGMALISLYDLPGQPVVLALRDDGQLAESWQGEEFPLMNELAYYANA